MAFEIFKETGARTKEFISVTETKSFGLSRAFLDKHGITKNHKAVLFYDPVDNKVALHFSLNNPKFGFSVRIANERHGGIIIARSFFDLKSIDPRRYAGRYSNFEEVPLTRLGQRKEGTGFVIALKDRAKDAATTEMADEPDSAVIDEEVFWKDIPF